MFTNISWGSYLTAVIIAMVIWYSAVIIKFYSGDLKKILSGETKIRLTFFKTAKKEHAVQNTIKSSFSGSFETLEDAEQLSIRIEQAAAESAEKGLSKEQFQNYLSMLLDEYPYVKISSLKENINKLMVSESSKYPPLQLTLSEADSLWEGSVF
ncbi:MAG: hypothetical protein REI96_13150 [Flavobacterium nitrogenifigens]|uniref:hypothetical protein n=1 Tax=Flavobacterium nitrogenifigens TaxID=1617283 RepID=UPI002807A240|nr:hypothetical protein [Flavobacterium nitrogenifigens]MDQ8013391.1 hypothetical protein [Flavobacterium nitrogenifigens]